MSQSVVLITGATAGIGRATALAYAAKGARLVCSGRNAAAGEALISELRGMGAEADFVAADVSREDDVIRLVGHAIERFGRLDIAVNSAGTEGTPGSMVEQTVESYTTTFDANVLGTFLCMKHELRAMIPQKHGAIVNLSSTMGSRGNPRNPIYVASKHATEGLTKSAALDAIKSNVRVNAVAPGPIETEMLGRLAGGNDRIAAIGDTIPAGRVGTPEEVADAILFLASDQATYVTGQILHVNGGKTAA